MTSKLLGLMLALGMGAVPLMGQGMPLQEVPQCALPEFNPGDPQPTSGSDLLFYSIPMGRTEAGLNRVAVSATVKGELFLKEEFSFHPASISESRIISRQGTKGKKGFSDPNSDPPQDLEKVDAIVFEFLSNNEAYRNMLHELGQRPGSGLEVEIVLNGMEFSRFSFADFLLESEIVKSNGILPMATGAFARLFSGAQASGITPRIRVCGDGVCSPTGNPFGEDCETCPQDCGGSCSICGNGFCGSQETCETCSQDCGSCPVCPTTLPSETRTVLVSIQWNGSYCYEDYIFWGDNTWYDYLKYTWKRFTVSRVKNCDGSITETVVSGSTYYFNTFCYSRVGGFCFGPLIIPYPLC